MIGSSGVLRDERTTAVEEASYRFAYAFLTFAVLCFVIRHKGEPLLKWDYAQSHMAWGLFYLFAGGAALGEILSQTGAAKFIADTLVPFAGGGGFRAVFVFSLMTMVITQITNNTAAIAIMARSTTSASVHWMRGGASTTGISTRSTPSGVSMRRPFSSMAL